MAAGRNNSSSKPSKRLLLVEDDPAILHPLRDLLELEGYSVVTAQDGIEALARLRTERPALIILDLMMPNMDGWEFRSRQLSDPSLATVPVVVLTADPRAHEDSKPLGNAIILRKPFDTNELLQIVREHAG